MYGIYGLSNNRLNHRAGPRLLSYYGLIGVGICSGGYHMTLKYHTQMCTPSILLLGPAFLTIDQNLADELSMHLLTTPLLYRLLTFKTSTKHTKLVGLALLTVFTTVMIAHMVMDEFLLHATAFGLAVYLIVVRVLKLISQHVPDPLVRKSLRKIAVFGLRVSPFAYIPYTTQLRNC